MIVTVPLIVLGGFIGVQIANEVQRASRTAALAEQIALLPAIMRYATSVGAAVAPAEFGLILDRTNAVFVDDTEPLEELALRDDLDPAFAEAVTRLLADGRELNRSASMPGTAVPARIEQMRVFGMQVQHTVRTLINQTENVNALNESGRLLDLWQVRLMPLDQAVAFTQTVADSDQGRNLLDIAFASERAALGALRGTENEQQTLADLRAEAEHRHSLLLSPTTSATRTPDLTASLLKSVEAGDRLLDASIEQIVTTLIADRDAARLAAIRNAILVAVAVACAVTVTLAVTKLLVSSLRRLRDGTAHAAYHDLPAAVTMIRSGTDPSTVTIDRIGVETDEEIGQVARAVDGMNTQALRLATEQAALRRQITTMLETLARRNRSLVDRQLSLIEALEFKERDPDRLQNLFELDHLAARMRRTGESLLVLADTRSRRTSRVATPLEDVMRASVSQVENYERVRLGVVPPVTLTGTVVDDLIHLLTELLDNSLRASDPRTSVIFLVFPAVEEGLLLEIVDRGVGMPPEELERANYRLVEGAETDAQATRHMGLYVVGRVAQRHGLRVRLRATIDAGATCGVTASVYLPAALIQGRSPEIAWISVDQPRRLPTQSTPVPATGVEGHGPTRPVS
ncbi:sensor histidine kinase [Rhodococcus sp. NPDC003382]